jgi:hypothetical protein
VLKWPRLCRLLRSKHPTHPSPLAAAKGLDQLIFGYLFPTNDRLSALYLRMAYHKRPATNRICVQCHEAYQAVDRRRLYCSSSCKVQACKAKRRQRLHAKAQPLAALPAQLESPAKPGPQTLAWNAQNLTVLSTAAALGNLGVKAGEHVVASLKQPKPAAPLPALTPQLVEPLSWLPAGLLAASAPRVALESVSGGPAVTCVQLQYLGHTLYYQPSQRLLLWRVAPGNLQVLRSAADVAFVAEQVPYDETRSPQPALPAPSILKTLG